MESVRHHRVPVLAVTLALTIGFAGGEQALAQEQPPPFDEEYTTTTVYTDPQGVTVDSQYQGRSNAVGGTGTQASGGPRCYLRAVPGSEMTEDLTLEYWARQMRYAPYYVICGSQNRGVVWIEIRLGDPGAGPALDPRDIAMRLRERMPVPQATVEMNPGEGVVGVESWFWLQGYDGARVTDSTNAFARLVEVEATVTRYEWSFGDGTTIVSDSPGQAYPSRSEVRHIYQRSSAGMPDGYRVDVTFVFAVRYRVDGGAWVELPGITRSAQSDHPVRESQAVISR